MRILISGYHNPHYVTVTEYIESAVRSIGHDVIPFNDRDHIFPGRLRTKIHLLQKLSVRAINRGLLKLAARTQPDVVLITGGHRITPGGLQMLRQHGFRVVLWTTDPPRESDIMMRTAALYDYVFCHGTEYVDIFHQIGFSNAEWMPMMACDPQVHHPADVSKGEILKFGSNVVFVGSYYPNRADMLHALCDHGLALWGPGWDALPFNSHLRVCIRGTHTPPNIWSKIYSASKIVLSIHYRDPEERFPVYQASPRVFEALACGAFVLTDRQKDVLSLFRDGEHLVAFDDDQDLRNKVDYFLQHPEECERIAASGMREALDKHTYVNRVRDLFAHINFPHPRRENASMHRSAPSA